MNYHVYKLAGPATERRLGKTAGVGGPIGGKQFFVLTFSLVHFFWVKPKEMNITI